MKINLTTPQIENLISLSKVGNHSFLRLGYANSKIQVGVISMGNINQLITSIMWTIPANALTQSYFHSFLFNWKALKVYGKETDVMMDYKPKSISFFKANDDYVFLSNTETFRADRDVINDFNRKIHRYLKNAKEHAFYLSNEQRKKICKLLTLYKEEKEYLTEVIYSKNKKDKINSQMTIKTQINRGLPTLILKDKSEDIFTQYSWSMLVETRILLKALSIENSQKNGIFITIRGKRNEKIMIIENDAFFSIIEEIEDEEESEEIEDDNFD